MTLTVGLIVNPRAGIGGLLAAKGSDQVSLADALDAGISPPSPQRASKVLAGLESVHGLRWRSWRGLGSELLTDAGLQGEVLGESRQPSEAADTVEAVVALCRANTDLILFVGGDGTARDVLLGLRQAQRPEQPCLGVPAGVKMHSGVFAVSADAALKIVQALHQRELVAPVPREVRDFDRAVGDDIQVRTYGVLNVPELAGYLQHTKEGGRESEPLVLEEISADIQQRYDDGPELLLGPGGTVAAIKQRLGAETPTLRGFDYRDHAGNWRFDLNAKDIAGLGKDVHLVISFTRVQGFLLGRGNQQLVPEFLQRLNWSEQVNVVASRSKLLSLEGRPLLVDSGDIDFDHSIVGLQALIAGYEDRLLYPLRAADAPLY